MKPASSPPPDGHPYAVVGRYAIFEEIASGGMATVHLGRLLGAAGFSRTVAIKRLHPQFARDAEFSTMFLDEARLAARISHPNVVQTIDVVPIDKEILLVMEYVHGAPFAHLLGTSRRAGKRVPPRVIAGVMVGALEGLHAAHEARSETGAPLGVVHRDVSPQNILVGVEGVPRVIDFGVAKAFGKMHATRDGQLKGKLQYMSPEQVRNVDVTRLSDVFSASIVLWEALAGERLFDGSNPAEIIMNVLSADIVPPQQKIPDLPIALCDVAMKGLSREPGERFATAREMAAAIETAMPIAPAREIAEWVESTVGAALGARAKLVEAIERAASASPQSGEHTRIEGLKASLGGLGAEDLESGPRPILGAESASRRDDAIGLDATFPQKTRSQSPPAPSSPPASPALPQAPVSGVTPKASDAPPQAPPAPSSQDAAAPSPHEQPQPSPLDSGLSRRREGSGARAYRIPVRTDDDRASLTERLVWPIRLVVAGVLVSLAGFVLRQLGVPLPVRPSLFAGALVAVGVVWAFARVALPSRE